MNKKGNGKAAQRRKAAESGKRRYGLWVLGIVVVIAVVILVISALPGSGPDSSPAPTPIPSPPDIPRISPEEVKALLDAGSNIVIIDTRSRGEYERVHIAGAISIPLEETAQRYRELQGYDEVVTYCT